MIKKTAAVSLILLAYLVILAHAVTHIHYHNDSDTSNVCLLKQEFVIPASNKTLENGDYGDSNLIYDFVDLYLPFAFKYSFLQPVSGPIETVPAPNPFIHPQLTASAGLRAPPMV